MVSRFIRRKLYPLLPNPAKRRLVIITGARQTGKTTLAQQKYKGLRYINLDAPENREALRAILSSNWGRDVGRAVLDEGQKEPSIFEKVKYSFDEKSIDFSVILGSSQILLLKRIRETLAGRASIYNLWPLMLSELNPSETQPPLIERLIHAPQINNLLKKEPGMILPNESDPKRDAEIHLLTWGGMPALLELPDEDRWKWLKDYEYTYLERDLADLARLDDLEPFRKFQKLSALRTARLLNYSELARDAGVSVDTARRYLEYLRLSYQVLLIQPYYKNLTSTVVKTPKLYWLDTGLLRVLSGQRSLLSGEVYETYVVSELVKWIRTNDVDAENYFYRTRSGLDLDILLQTPTGILGFEIKSRETIRSLDLRPLTEVARAVGKEWKGGIVIYRGSQILQFDKFNVWAIPSHRLFT